MTMWTILPDSWQRRLEHLSLHRTYLAVWLVLAALGAAMAPCSANGDAPDGFPAKPIKIMAPANPGGGWDQLARLLQFALVRQELVAVPVEVFNRGGAGGTIGLAELMTSHRRDAHVIMIGGSVLVSSELAHGSPVSLRNTTPLAKLLSEYLVIAVPASSPYTSLQELVATFAKNPERITWGGGSAGGIDHILVGLIASRAGVEISKVRYVAFPGGGDAAAAIMGGKVSAGVSGYAEWEGLAAGGRMRLLAVSSPQRVGDLDVPTLVEQGVDVVLENWRGIFAPPEILAGERDWYVNALTTLRDSAEWRKILQRNSWADTFLTGEEFAEFLRHEYLEMEQVLGDLGLGAGGQGYAIVGPYVFPLIIAAGLLLSLLFAILNARTSTAVDETELSAGQLAQLRDSEDGVADFATLPRWPRFFLSSSVTLTYILLLKPLGFLVTTPLFVAAHSRISGSRNLLRDMLVSVILTGCIFLIFRHFLGIEMP